MMRVSAPWGPLGPHASNVHGANPRTNTVSPEPSALSSWGLAIARALQSRGHDPRPLFGRAGLDAAALSDPEARYPLRAITRLWRLAVEATNDPCFGLDVARHVSPAAFHALGLSILSSTTLREAFERIVRYYRLVSDATALTFERLGETYRFAISALYGEPQADEAIDALFAVIVRMGRMLTDRRFAPALVELRRPAPPDPLPFTRCFRGQVVFGAGSNALTLNALVCDQRLDGANPRVARMNDEAVAQALDRMRSARLSDRVRSVLVDRLPSGEPSENEIARAVAKSKRTFQRNLSAEGTTYTRLVDDTRRELAMAYVLDSRYTLAEVAYLLGFSGGNNFTRAFRRWTGKSPSGFRR
jgi:AraC-like DNA-binding protein